MKYDAIMIKPEDNVAMALRDLSPDTRCRVHSGRDSLVVRVSGPISYGHKFAVIRIERGTDIIKYGEVMGRATAAIEAGEHAHVHNIESLRGRGDLLQGEQ